MARGRIRVVLITQATADETTSQPVNVLGLQNLTFYLIGSGDTISGGSITYEEATGDPAHSDQTYDGTWSIIGTAVTASDVSAGKIKATHLSQGAYSLIRARIDTAISGGGNVTVVLVGSE